jgi:hypothetical protein
MDDEAEGMAPVLPPCTQVIIETVQSVDSGKVKAGDFFKFKSVGAVTFHGKVVIPSGTLGYGVVTLAIPAGRGHGGALGLEPLYFKLPDGDEVHVVRDRRPNALAAQGASGQLPGYVGAIPVPGWSILVGAFNWFHKGKNVTIAPGALASVFASDSPATAKCQSEQPPG